MSPAAGSHGQISSTTSSLRIDAVYVTTRSTRRLWSIPLPAKQSFPGVDPATLLTVTSNFHADRRCQPRSDRLAKTGARRRADPARGSSSASTGHREGRPGRFLTARPLWSASRTVFMSTASALRRSQQRRGHCLTAPNPTDPSGIVLSDVAGELDTPSTAPSPPSYSGSWTPSSIRLPSPTSRVVDLCCGSTSPEQRIQPLFLRLPHSLAGRRSAA